ncbi:MAG: hypothetical protein USCGTAYLOR_00815 [Chromatiales bacterium USCg_Taylor]|nr:MAG: hypothetical protein USCGTAYLOR_00815 [Chromatiales bacterium USCg_Taylor]
MGYGTALQGDLPWAVAAVCAEHQANPFFGWVVETYGRLALSWHWLRLAAFGL